MPLSQTASTAILDFGAAQGPVVGTAPTGTITLVTVADGNTVTLSDGTTTKTFEFDNNVTVTPGNVLVTLNASDTISAANLRDAINAQVGFKFVATSALGVVTVTGITTEGNETAGNAYTMAKVGAPISLSGATLSGGVNADLRCKAGEFRVKMNRGGKLDLKFENPDGSNDLVVTVQVATNRTGTTPSGTGGYANTSAANNLTAVATVTVPRRSSKEATILLRRDIDNYVRILGTGNARGQVQIRGAHILEPLKI